MQRQLLDIADRIPSDILLNLLKSFAQILTRDPEPAPRTPFIRAFAKIRDDSAERKFSAIVEEDEDNHVIPHQENLYHNDSSDIDGGSGNEVENECSFNYKVSNVVTQEVIYSMNGNEHDDDQQQQPQDSTSAAIADDSNNSNKDETNGDQMSDNRADNDSTAADENLLNENHDAMIENGRGSRENGYDAIDEGIEVEMPKLTESQDATAINGDAAENCEEVEKKFDEISQEADVRVETCNNAENGEIMDDSQKALDDEVESIQKVSLDEIQREIQEMQMFIKHKNAQEEAVVNQEIRDSKKIEDAFKVDVCLNLKKKREDKKDESHSHHRHHHHKKHSKSKAILANYLNEAGKEYLPKSSPIFDPAVPNTPEDFMKEKCVSEKINKKKQKIKNLDVNWQRLVDSQKKVYK
jgi:hypothetical protein